MDFINNGTGRPKPKAGYRCKICGMEGGTADSHWYQLCPFKGKTSDKRTFNPPRKGYICKFCHKTGGEPDSHWFQQCPKRTEYEGVQVPHPLKLRAGGNPGMMNMLNPQTISAQAAAVALNLGVMQPNQLDYSQHAQQFTANSLGIFMYPNNMMNGQQMGQLAQGMTQINGMSQMQQQMSQAQQQQMYFLQQQLASHSISQPQGSFSVEIPSHGQGTSKGNNDRFNLNRDLYGNFSGNEQQRPFDMNINAFDKQGSEQNDQSDDGLLSHITKQTQEMSFNDKESEESNHLEPVSDNVEE